MVKRFHRWIAKIQSFAGKKWYLPFIAILSALDAYIFFVPNEALLVPAVLSQPKKWKRTAFAMTLGSAVGATSFAGLTGRYGPSFVEFFFPGILQSHEWARTTGWIHDHGAIGIFLISLSPLPQHPGVAIAGLANLSLIWLLIAVFLGRIVKYGVLAWCVSHRNACFKKFNFLRFFNKNGL